MTACDIPTRDKISYVRTMRGIPPLATELQKLKKYVKLKCPTLHGYAGVGNPYVVSDSKKG